MQSISPHIQGMQEIFEKYFPKTALKIILETSYVMKFTLWNNISPSNIKYSIKNKKTLTGSQI